MNQITPTPVRWSSRPDLYDRLVTFIEHTSRTHASVTYSALESLTQHLKQKPGDVKLIATHLKQHSIKSNPNLDKTLRLRLKPSLAESCTEWFTKADVEFSQFTFYALEMYLNAVEAPAQQAKHDVDEYYRLKAARADNLALLKNADPVKLKLK